MRQSGCGDPRPRVSQSQPPIDRSCRGVASLMSCGSGSNLDLTKQSPKDTQFCHSTGVSTSETETGTLRVSSGVRVWWVRFCFSLLAAVTELRQLGPVVGALLSQGV